MVQLPDTAEMGGCRCHKRSSKKYPCRENDLILRYVSCGLYFWPAGPSAFKDRCGSECLAGYLKVFCCRHAGERHDTRRNPPDRHLCRLDEKRFYEEKGQGKGRSNRFWRRHCRHVEHDHRIEEDNHNGGYNRHYRGPSYPCDEGDAAKVRS